MDQNTAPSEEENDKINHAIRDGDIGLLLNIVIDGHGSTLLNRTSDNTDIQEFLLRVPAYMAKISAIHAAASVGDLRELQSLLDRKQLALARDNLGRAPLHVAVLNNQSAVARHLATAYPQTLKASDAEGCTPLDYASRLQDDGAMYEYLATICNPKNVQKMQHVSDQDVVANPRCSNTCCLF